VADRVKIAAEPQLLSAYVGCVVIVIASGDTTGGIEDVEAGLCGQDIVPVIVRDRFPDAVRPIEDRAVTGYYQGFEVEVPDVECEGTARGGADEFPALQLDGADGIVGKGIVGGRVL